MKSVDSHAHVFDPVRFPLRDTGGHMPAPHECGTPDEFLTVLDAHGMTHGLVVNPQAGYATDNACMLDAIARSRGRLKGIALIDHQTTDRELQRLADGGVVGARFNLLFSHATSIRGDAGIRLLERVRDVGWFAQIYFRGDELLDALPVLQASRVPIVADHLGAPDSTRPISQPGFQALLRLGREGAAVKLSGAFRSSKRPWPHDDLDPFVAALIDAFSVDNCVWGSDWPYVRMQQRMDYGPQRALLDRWIPDADARRKVLWNTPSRLFGFA